MFDNKTQQSGAKMASLDDILPRIKVSIDGFGELTEKEVVKINLSYGWVEIETLPVSKNFVSKIERYTCRLDKVKIAVNMDNVEEPQKEVD